ncbi:MAG: hypothetical protein KatS3mg122_3318 [Caldimonas sp.]|nr:MAG: hypothetical protein KatS3mg122_3318 [Caldimonas sp.]
MQPGRTSSLVVYDFLAASGGAERLSLTVARLLAADVFVGFRVAGAAASFDEAEGVRLRCVLRGTWRLGAWSCLLVFLRFLLPIDRSRRDVVFVSGVFAVGALLWTRARKRIYYCHTPPKFCFEEFDAYFGGLGNWSRLLARVGCAVFARVYAFCLRRADHVFSNSRYTQQRLRTHVGIDSEVLYPPPASFAFEDAPAPKPSLSRADYLSLARHEPAKRVDLVCQAFAEMPEQTLIVASSGSLTKDLETRYAQCPNIRFVGTLSDRALAERIRASRATIYIPQGEDFGMSVVESLALGTPVITVREGGISEILDDRMIEWLLPACPTVEQIKATVRSTPASLGRLGDVAQACRSVAARFHPGRFASALREIVS